MREFTMKIFGELPAGRMAPPPGVELPQPIVDMMTRIQTNLGWSPVRRFDEGLCDTVAWYLNNYTWWERVQAEAYRASQALYLAHVAE